jgi:hypothetical protein
MVSRLLYCQLAISYDLSQTQVQRIYIHWRQYHGLVVYDVQSLCFYLLCN